MKRVFLFPRLEDDYKINAKLIYVKRFSKIDGLDLTVEAENFEMVYQCEWADYPNFISKKHWSDMTECRYNTICIGFSV